MQDKFFGDVAALIALLASDGRLTAAQADELYIENGKRQADAQALADVRTLDDWARGEKGRSHDTGFAFDGLGYFCTLQERTVIKVQAFEAATPDEARAKAAAWVREQKP